MDYISQSPIHCSKGNIKCVIKCTKFPEKQSNGYMFKTEFSSIKHWYNKLGDALNKKKGKNNYTFPDNKLLASSKQLKLCPRYFLFPNKQKNICDYNARCFMSSKLIIDDIIMNLFSDNIKQTTDSVKTDSSSKI